MSNLLTLFCLFLFSFFFQGYDPRKVTRVTFPTCFRALFFVICEFQYSTVCPCKPRTTYCARGCHFSINISGFRYGHNHSRSWENASCHHLNPSTKVSGLVSVTESGSKTESTLQRSISLSNSILCLPRRL